MPKRENLHVVSDLDGVVAHSQPPVLEVFNQKFGTELTYADWTAFDLLTLEAARLSGESVAAVAAWLYAADVMRVAEPIPGLKDALKELAPLGALPEIVTSRPSSQSEITLRWTKEKLREIEKVHIRGLEHVAMRGDEFKIFMIGQLKARVYVDDDLSLLMNVSELTAQGKFPHLTSILLVDRPWNDTQTLPPGIRRAGNWRAGDYGWSDIVQIVKNLTNEPK